MRWRTQGNQTPAFMVFGAGKTTLISVVCGIINPGQEAAIFEQFERGEKESTVPGVGLGLAIRRATGPRD